jgi:hypothetical protein
MILDILLQWQKTDNMKSDFHYYTSLVFCWWEVMFENKFKIFISHKLYTCFITFIKTLILELSTCIVFFLTMWKLSFSCYN